MAWWAVGRVTPGSCSTRELTRQIPSAHVETIEGSGHVPYRSHPDLWLETLLGYLF
ncbi:MAG: hypothetical protein BMS9Abin17_0209 [Acidimicrobiia bacterium]|nr:MAG: hypothetical protein BMS9Abin17_0209 [Acidimicrobiia bacterium]